MQKLLGKGVGGGVRKGGKIPNHELGASYLITRSCFSFPKVPENDFWKPTISSPC